MLNILTFCLSKRGQDVSHEGWTNAAQKKKLEVLNYASQNKNLQYNGLKLIKKKTIIYCRLRGGGCRILSVISM